MSLTLEGMAWMYCDHLVAIHGIPQKFIHDCGPQFHSKFIKELYQLLGIGANYTMAYHPQTNGQPEQMNQEIEYYLQLFIIIISLTGTNGYPLPNSLTTTKFTPPQKSHPSLQTWANTLTREQHQRSNWKTPWHSSLQIICRKLGTKSVQC